MAVRDWRTRILHVFQSGEADPEGLFMVPRMDQWYNAHMAQDTLPQDLRGLSLWDIHRRLGLGIIGRSGPAFRMEYGGDVEVQTETRGDKQIYRYVTPVGTVSVEFTTSPELRAQGVRAYQTKHMIDSLPDYRVVLYLVEQTCVIPDYEAFAAYEQEIGADGIAWVFAGFSPMHDIMMNYIGYENFFYELADHPNEVHALFEALLALSDRLLEVVAASPAPIVAYCGNYHEHITYPELFRRYITPVLQKYADRLHACGKLLATHTDGEMAQLIRLLLDTGVDIAECFTPAPMTSYSITSAKRVWGDRIRIYGGIPSSVLSAQQYDHLSFTRFMSDLIAEARRFPGIILGMGDNLPADGDLGRVEWIRDRLAALQR
jgi:hypothetical protein